MGAAIVSTGGHTRISLQRDQEGHRTYKVVYRVAVTSQFNNVISALSAPGLPLPGSYLSIGTDVDLWAFCQYEVTVTPVQDETELHQFYDLEFTFSTRNPLRCASVQIENPLLEPPKITGTYTKYTVEAVVDIDGLPVRNSSHEQLRGPQVEFDVSRLSIRISQNVAALNGPLLDSYKDCVNDRDLWGFSARCIKLSGISFEKKYYGTCFPYYARTLEFDTNVLTFDREVLDEGTKVLRGTWNRTTGQWDLINIGGSPPNPDNPSHFQRFYDWNGNYCRTLLDGRGRPIVAALGTAPGGPDFATILVRKYEERNLLLLGIPAVI